MSPLPIEALQDNRDTPLQGRPGRSLFENLPSDKTIAYKTTDGSTAITSIVVANKLDDEEVGCRVIYRSNIDKEFEHPCWKGAGEGGFEEDCDHDIDTEYQDDELMNASIGDEVSDAGGYLVAVLDDQYLIAAPESEHLEDVEYNDAMDVNGSEHGGHDDWTLPTIDELKAIYENWNDGPIPSSLFSENKYWSDGSDQYVDFETGEEGGGSGDTTGIAVPLRRVDVKTPKMKVSETFSINRWGMRKIPPGESVEIIQAQREMLMPGDEILIEAEQSDALDAWISVME